MLQNKTYDILVWLTQVVLPALGALYATLAGIWGLPYAESIVGTVAAVVTCLGVFLRVQSSQYQARRAIDD